MYNLTEVIEDEDIYGEGIRGGKLNITKSFNKLGKRLVNEPLKQINKQVINPTEKFINTASDKVGEYIETVIEGRNDYPPKVRDLIKQYGNKTIKSIVADRTPVPDVLTGALNVVSFGAFKKRFNKLPYDKLFHLRLDLTFSDNSRLAVEKNEVINMYTNPKRLKGSEQIDINNVPFNLTLNALLEGGKKIQGSKFFNYSAYNNNCQDFIIALLKGSNIGTEQNYNFIKQNTESLFKGDSFLRKFANTVTDIGAKANEITTGTGIENIYKNKLNNVNNINNINKMPKYYSDSDSSDSEPDSEDERDIINHIHSLKSRIKRHNEMKGGKIKIAKAFKKLGNVVKEGITKGAPEVADYVTKKKGGLASDVIKYGIPATSSALLGGLATYATGGNPVAGVTASALGSKLGAMGAEELQKKTGTGIHIDIGSHNARGNSKTGEGLRKSKTGKLSRTKNTSLEQLLSAKSERDEKELKKNLLEMSKTVKEDLKAVRGALGAGIRKKGSIEAKEHMARLRAMRGKK